MGQYQTVLDYLLTRDNRHDLWLQLSFLNPEDRVIKLEALVIDMATKPFEDWHERDKEPQVERMKSFDTAAANLLHLLWIAVQDVHLLPHTMLGSDGKRYESDHFQFQSQQAQPHIGKRQIELAEEISGKIPPHMTVKLRRRKRQFETSDSDFVVEEIKRPHLDETRTMLSRFFTQKWAELLKESEADHYFDLLVQMAKIEMKAGIGWHFPYLNVACKFLQSFPISQQRRAHTITQLIDGAPIDRQMEAWRKCMIDILTESWSDTIGRREAYSYGQTPMSDRLVKIFHIIENGRTRDDSTQSLWNAVTECAKKAIELEDVARKLIAFLATKKHPGWEIEKLSVVNNSIGLAKLDAARFTDEECSEHLILAKLAAKDWKTPTGFSLTLTLRRLGEFTGSRPTFEQSASIDLFP